MLMFQQGGFQRQMGCSTWQSKLVPNTVLKMPLSLQPFLHPIDCSPQLDDTLDCNLPDQFSRLATSQSPYFPNNWQPCLSHSIFTRPLKAQTKPNNCNFRSNRKTFLRIIRLLKQKELTGRIYLVEYRCGNQPATHRARIAESTILQKDPQLLIEFLTAKAKVERQ